jgi:hypothetical protein
MRDDFRRDGGKAREIADMKDKTFVSSSDLYNSLVYLRYLRTDVDILRSRSVSKELTSRHPDFDL